MSPSSVNLAPSGIPSELLELELELLVDYGQEQ